MDSSGIAYKSNSVSNAADYASRQQARRDTNTGLTSKRAEIVQASGQQSGALAISSSEQAGIQLAGSKDQEFLLYDAQGLTKKININSGERTGGTERLTNSSFVNNDFQLPKTSDRPAVNSPSDNSDLKQGQSPAETKEIKEDDPQVQQEIAQLRSIEIKVKAHEAAHKAAGSTMTGPISYSYTRGPDGKNYITGGEVPINISTGSTPQETISRMQQVIQAALAPADPSPQDRAVAAQASTLAQNARQQKSEEAFSTALTANQEKPASQDTLKGQLESMLQRAYSDPAVTGSAEPEERLFAETRQNSSDGAESVFKA